MRCAFCHDALDLRAMPCPGCGTHLHADCWPLSRSGCPTLGCSGRSQPTRRAPRAPRRPRGRSSGFLPLSFGLSVATVVPALACGLLALIVAEVDRGGSPLPLLSGALAIVMLLTHLLGVPALWLAQELRARELPRPRNFGPRYREAFVAQLKGVAITALAGGLFLGALALFDLGVLALLFTLPIFLGTPTLAAWIGESSLSPAPRAARVPAAAPPLVVTNLPIRIRLRPAAPYPVDSCPDELEPCGELLVAA